LVPVATSLSPEPRQATQPQRHPTFLLDLFSLLLPYSAFQTDQFLSLYVDVVSLNNTFLASASAIFPRSPDPDPLIVGVTMPDMPDFHSSDDWNNNQWWLVFNSFQPTAPLPCDDATSFNPAPNLAPPDDTRKDSTPSSSDTLSSGTLVEGIQTPYSNPRKRRQTSERSSDTPARTPKTRKVKAPHKTAKIREKGACFLCQTKRKEVNFVYKQMLQFQIFALF